ncbi:MAG: DNA-J related domain-containing protein [Gammaproteobacteria bacterium]
MTADSGDDFSDVLLAVLRSHPRGTSEHELFKTLANRGDGRFEDAVFHTPLALFRAHFLLFHNLYRLQERLCRARRGRLQITPLRIRLWDGEATAGTGMDDPDPLREYYLDMNNLADTTDREVRRMLGEFWSGLGRNEQRREALAVLGLSDPVDDRQIKRAYRRLAMAHHPDRGGDTARLQTLNAAMALLSPNGKR